MKLTNQTIEEYRKDLCYIEYELYEENYQELITINLDEINNIKYKETLLKYIGTKERINTIKNKIIACMNKLDTFKIYIRYYNHLAEQKLSCLIGYKKNQGYFVDLCENPYKLSMKNENEMDQIIEYDQHHDIPKGTLLTHEEGINIIENLLFGNSIVLGKIDWFIHEKNISSLYSKKNTIKITGKTLEERTKEKIYTQEMCTELENEDLKKRVYNYCEKIASFIHCPVKLNDYKRMESYAQDEELTEEVYKIIKKLKFPIGTNTIMYQNKIFFWYSVALLSQTSFNREEYDKYLEQLVIETTGNYKTNKSDFELLKRNFELLQKDYKYLEKYLLVMNEYLNKQES